MTSEWRPSTWGEEISLEYGKALRGYQDGKGGYRVFGSNGPIGWTDKFLTKGPGVILGRKGAYRGVHFSKDPFFVIDTAYYVEPKSEMDKRWLYYAIQHYKLGEIDDGSPIPSTTRAAVYVRDLEVPPVEQQREIGRVLAALDDLIDHNRALAANLEAIARALFKSWFVDFDPVRAKAAGEAPPGLAPDLAALFPDRFVDSELGEIPEGWSVKTLGDAFELNPRRSLSKGSLAPYLDMSSTPTKGHVPDQSISREFSSGSKFMNGDTLLARITPCLENGKAAFVDFLDKQEVGWGSTEFIVLRPKAPLPPYFGYLLARYAPFKAHAISSMSGTSGRQRVQPDSLATWELAVPDEAVAEAFGAVVEPLRAAIACANEESRVLSMMRDLLLPRLISGKLRVEDAEAALEAA